MLREQFQAELSLSQLEQRLFDSELFPFGLERSRFDLQQRLFDPELLPFGPERTLFDLELLLFHPERGLFDLERGPLHPEVRPFEAVHLRADVNRWPFFGRRLSIHHHARGTPLPRSG